MRGALKDFPAPWVVGPSETVWVGSDVEFKDGKWTETCPNPRLVASFDSSKLGLARLIVDAVNEYAWRDR